jgi:hypothetical protein|tara:strand:+ start:1896 stop:2126 length:231 start_codon:yes stop_codon:yes gene_type:complete
LALSILSCIAVVGVVAVEGEDEGDVFAISKSITKVWQCYGYAITMIEKKRRLKQQRVKAKNKTTASNKDLLIRIDL